MTNGICKNKQTNTLELVSKFTLYTAVYPCSAPLHGLWNLARATIKKRQMHFKNVMNFLDCESE